MNPARTAAVGRGHFPAAREPFAAADCARAGKPVCAVRPPGFFAPHGLHPGGRLRGHRRPASAGAAALAAVLPHTDRLLSQDAHRPARPPPGPGARWEVSGGVAVGIGAGSGQGEGAVLGRGVQPFGAHRLEAVQVGGQLGHLGAQFVGPLPGEGLPVDVQLPVPAADGEQNAAARCRDHHRADRLGDLALAHQHRGGGLRLGQGLLVQRRHRVGPARRSERHHAVLGRSREAAACELVVLVEGDHRRQQRHLLPQPLAH